MSKTAVKISRDARAVIIYTDRDITQRQRFTVRNAYGRILYQCRHIKALGTYLKSKKYNFYEYGALPHSAREALDNLRAEWNARHRDTQPQRVTLREVWPS